LNQQAIFLANCQLLGADSIWLIAICQLLAAPSLRL
jgi:hypothetical protein